MEFKDFGYLTYKPCEVCGARPARMEPRFLYIACKDCYEIPPVEISRKKNG